MEEIKVGRVYRHFKGNYYLVLSIAIHSETKEKLVIYQRVNEQPVYARPYDMFNSPVDKDKYPEVKQVKRFQIISEEEAEKLFNIRRK